MDRIEHIEEEIRELSPDELSAFRTWFLQFDAQVWDRQIEADAENGKLLSLAERALEQHRSRRSTRL